MIDFLVLHCEDAKTRESNELRKSEALTEKRRLPAKPTRNWRRTSNDLVVHPADEPEQNSNSFSLAYFRVFSGLNCSFQVDWLQ
jgi:hypothetical protein